MNAKRLFKYLLWFQREIRSRKETDNILIEMKKKGKRFMNPVPGQKWENDYDGTWNWLADSYFRTNFLLLIN